MHVGLLDEIGKVFLRPSKMLSSVNNPSTLYLHVPLHITYIKLRRSSLPSLHLQLTLRGAEAEGQTGEK